MKRIGIALLSLTVFALINFLAFRGALHLGWIRPTATKSSLPWNSNWNQAVAEASRRQVPILVDFTAEWCGACQDLESSVFSHALFMEKSKGFVLVRFDVTKESPENESLLKKFGIESLPTVVFAKPNGAPIFEPRIFGVPPVEDFLLTLERVSRTL